MRCNLVKYFTKATGKDGKEHTYTNFVLKFDNGQKILIKPAFYTDKNNKEQPSRDLISLSALADIDRKEEDID